MTDKARRSDNTVRLRQRAEGQLKARGVEGEAPPEGADTEQMLHELRVHQIELEMQNEELRRAQIELDESRERYRDLYDLAPVGYCTVSEQGIIMEANLTAASMLRVPRGTLQGRPLSHFIVPDDQDGYYRFCRKLFGAQAELMGTPQTCEVRLRRADDTPFWARMNATTAHGEDGATICRVALSNVHALKLAEEALQAALAENAMENLAASEKKYRKLVENTNSIIMRLTPDHVITFFNEYAATFFGYTEQEVLGRSVLDTILPAMDSEGRDLKTMLGAITRHPERYASNENENRCKDGRRVWVHWSNRAVRDEQGQITEILCVGSDITQRKQMETDALHYQACLRNLAKQLAASEEKKRWQVSRYIHDTIVQNLSLVSMRMATLQTAVQKQESAELRSTRGLIDDAIAECRTVMSDLTPALLYDLGLVPALHDFAETLQNRHHITVRVEGDDGDAPMDHALRGLLFQSTRELVMNALRHAGGSLIQVAVTRTDDTLTIRVADNGNGFTPEEDRTHADSHRGFGLFNIRERVEGLGGQLEIQSAPDQGTRAMISVPAQGLDTP